MSRGFEGPPAENPNNCTDPYAPSFWLGKPGALTQIRMPDADIDRASSDNFAVRNLLDGQSVDRSPYLCRTWTFQHQWLKPDVMSVFMEYATRQRGIGPFILIDPQMKNLLSPNQASGTDALHTTEGFAVTGYVSELSSTNASSVQGERALQWTGVVPSINTQTQLWDMFNHSAGSPPTAWGTLDSGQQAWQTAAYGGPVTGYGINGQNNGFMTLDTVNVFRSSIITGKKDGDMYFNGRFIVTPTGAPQTLWFIGRSADASNHYIARVLYTHSASHTLTLSIQKRVGGLLTPLVEVTRTDAYVNNTFFTVHFRIVGNELKASMWLTDTEVEPSTWQLEIADSSLTTGTAWGALARLETGNTNGTAFFHFDNFSLNTVQNDSIDLAAPTGLHGWCLPPNAVYAFSGYVKSSQSTATITPQVVQLDTSGFRVGAVSGSAISAVSGSWQSFCVTGVVPSGTVAPYLRPRLTMVGGVYDVGPTVLLDKLQFEITPIEQCTEWEYGQGQPLVGVRSAGESVPRILRTNMSYIAVEVT